MERDRILGMGSPQGDDQVGWRLIDRLSRRPLAGVEAVAIREPLRLLDWLPGCRIVVLVDACRSGNGPGTITRIEWAAEQSMQQAARSTHGLGLAAVLELARRLERLPRRLIVFGIEVERCEAGMGLSRTLQAGLRELERQVRREWHGVAARLGAAG